MSLDAVPTAVAEIPLSNPPRKRWTREECDALASSGLVDNQRSSSFKEI